MSENSIKADILVIDDMPANIRFLTQILTVRGYKVRAASDGDMGLSAALANPPDIILLGMMIPGMNGPEVCEHLKKDDKTRDVPVIFLSTLDQITDKIRGFSAGGADYITKPFHEEELLARVRIHLNTRNMHKRLQEKNILLEREIAERKKADEKTRESERKYRDLVQNANSIIIRLNPKWEITFFNEFAQKFFGYAGDEIIGKSVIGTIIPESKAMSVHEMGTLLKDMAQYPEKHRYYEYENMRRGGERVWVAWRNKIVTDGHGRIAEMLCIGNNITEQKRAGEVLRKYCRIVSATSDLVSLLDRDYVYQLVNEAYLSAHNRAYDEIVGHSVSDLHGGEIFEALIRKRLDRCLDGETIHYDEWFEYEGLGRKFMSMTYSPYLDENNTISGVVIVARDISKIKNFETELLMQKNNLAAIVRIQQMLLALPRDA